MRPPLSWRLRDLLLRRLRPPGQLYPACSSPRGPVPWEFPGRLLLRGQPIRWSLPRGSSVWPFRGDSKRRPGPLRRKLVRQTYGVNCSDCLWIIVSFALRFAHVARGAFCTVSTGDQRRGFRL